MNSNLRSSKSCENVFTVTPPIRPLQRRNSFTATLSTTNSIEPTAPKTSVAGDDNQNCSFFVDVSDEEPTLPPPPNNNPDNRWQNFNCMQCHKWFFCKRLSDHMAECSVINRENGSGDRNDQILHDNFFNSPQIRNDNFLLRNSIVCFLCGNRFSIRSIRYHQIRCVKKFQRLLSKRITKPNITPHQVDELFVKELEAGNRDFTRLDALNELFFKESLKNEKLADSRRL